jgi:membrane-bound lytic murein transglycosylase A
MLKHTLAVACVALFVCAHAFGQAVINTPTAQVTQRFNFTDDLDWAGLEIALTRQIEVMSARTSLNQRVRYGRHIYTLAEVRASSQKMLDLLNTRNNCVSAGRPASECDFEFSNAINANFNIYRPVTKRGDAGHGTLNPTKCTAYYSPDMQGSLTQTDEYRYPLYALPEDANLKKQSREAIDFDNILAGRGLEMIWLKDSLYDIYLLHVQGGGRVHVQTPEGEKFYYVSYAGENGLPFRFVYQHMVSRGMLPEGNRGVDAQRAYMEQNPHHAREVFSSNQSYIFFKFTDTEPLGVEMIPLTPMRSIAVDMTLYKHAGALSFVESERPKRGADGKITMEPFKRMFVAQDTGGAIKGAARIDMYNGYGPDAELAAYNTNVQGRHHFLLLKK